MCMLVPVNLSKESKNRRLKELGQCISYVANFQFFKNTIPIEIKKYYEIFLNLWQVFV